MTRTRRSLVLTNEAARHPFRASLPPRVFAVEAPVQDSSTPFTLRDWRNLLAAYVATFVVVSTFIS